MVGVADVDAHRQAQQLAAEVILQAGANDLLAVVEVLRADEPDHGVDQQRLQIPRDRVGPGLQRLLVDRLTAHAEVGARTQRGSLPGLQVHHVVADGAAAQRPAGRQALAQQGDVDTERRVGALGAGHRLEHQIDRGAPLDQLDGRGDMRQHTRLRRDRVALTDVVEQDEQVGGGVRRVGRRIDSDHRVAAAQQQAVQCGRGDPARIVGRVIGLQPGGQRARQADGGAERRGHRDRAGDRDQVLVAHDLADRGDHLRGDRPEIPAIVDAAASGSGPPATSSSQSRSPPTVRCEMRWNATRSWVSMIRRVTSSSS